MSLDANAETETPAGDAAADPAAPPAEAASPPPPPAAYRPEGLPDHLAGDSDQATIDRLWKAYGGARETIAKAGAVPETPDAYAFAAPENAPAFLKDIAGDDPAITLARKVAHAHGITDKQFGFVGAFLAEAAASGIIDAPLDPAAEMQAAGGEAAFTKARNDLMATGASLREAGKIGEPEYAELQLVASTAAGQRLLAALTARGPSAVATGDGAGAAGLTLESVKARMADERYSTRSTKYDPAFREETMALLRQLNGQ